MLGSHSKKFIFFHLYKSGGSSMRSVIHSQSEFNDIKPHTTPSEFMCKSYSNISSVELFNRYTTFAFVRNPWNWQVSLYHYMLRDASHFQYNIIKSMTFQEYIEWRVNDDLHTQYEFLSTDFSNNPEIEIDFVGKFEYIDSDFNFIMNKIGINGRLPHINKTEHNIYMDYYDEKSKNMISEAFHKDIEYFGYNFENSNIISGEEIYNKKL